MIIRSAQALDCNTLWFKDVTLRNYDDVHVVNPFE